MTQDSKIEWVRFLFDLFVFGRVCSSFFFLFLFNNPAIIDKGNRGHVVIERNRILGGIVLTFFSVCYSKLFESISSNRCASFLLSPVYKVDTSSKGSKRSRLDGPRRLSGLSKRSMSIHDLGMSDGTIDWRDNWDIVLICLFAFYLEYLYFDC